MSDSEIALFIHKSKPFKTTFYLRPFIKRCLSHLGISSGNFEFIFCSNPEIRAINKQFLSHDYETDIITFQHGELYISVDQVALQAPEAGHSFDEELQFVILHGLLHLCGEDDQTPEMRTAMLNKQTQILRHLGYFSHGKT